MKSLLRYKHLRSYSAAEQPLKFIGIDKSKQITTQSKGGLLVGNNSNFTLAFNYDTLLI